MLFDLKNVITNTHATVAIGASTSICAIMGLFIANVLILHFKGIDVKELRKRIVFMLVTLLLISFIPGVDFFGHLGSLISGFFLGLVLVAWRDVEVIKARNAGLACLAIYSLALTLIWVL
jgi:membrane associated rhomboid family serine protease